MLHRLQSLDSSNAKAPLQSRHFSPRLRHQQVEGKLSRPEELSGSQHAHFIRLLPKAPRRFGQGHSPHLSRSFAFERGYRLLAWSKTRFSGSLAWFFSCNQIAPPFICSSHAFRNIRSHLFFPPARGPFVGLLHRPETLGARSFFHLTQAYWIPRIASGRGDSIPCFSIAGSPEWSALQKDRGTMARTRRRRIDRGFAVEMFPHLRVSRNHQLLGGYALSIVLCPIGSSPLRLDRFGVTSLGLGLSKATKLKDIVFLCREQGVRWIVATLSTAETGNLRSISLGLSYRVVLKALTAEPIDDAWLGLDSLLVQFWASHSLSPRLTYEWVEEETDSDGNMERLLPESIRRGIVDLTKYNPFR